MATAATNPSVDELEKKEEELFKTGPLSVLTTSVKSNSQVGHLLLSYHCSGVLVVEQLAARWLVMAGCPMHPAARQSCLGWLDWDGEVHAAGSSTLPFKLCFLPSHPVVEHRRALVAGAHQLQEQQEAAGPGEGFRQALQHDP